MSDSARRPAPLSARLARAGAATREFLRRIYEKAGEDNIFFMAGAIAFNVLVAFVPLVLSVLGMAGFILRRLHADPSEVLLGYIVRGLPPVNREFQLWVRENVLREIIESSTGLLSIGMVILIWVSTRLVGTLRTALREIFDIQQDRGIVSGKIFDIKMVLAAGTLFALNVGLTVGLEIVTRTGLAFLGVEWDQLPGARFYGRIVAFLTIWVMFLLIYRFLPARRIRWTTALVAATFTAVFYELMKQAFSWYVTNVADYTSTYGTLTTLIILIFWIYYVAVVFILGGEVAQVIAMQRIRRRQRERLSAPPGPSQPGLTA